MSSIHSRITNKRGFYEGGKWSRANRDFYNATSPFEYTAILDRDTMRARARWLHENNPIMANIDKAILNNVVGKGIGLQSKTGNKKIDDAIEKRFKHFIDNCDITGRTNFFDMQMLVLESRMVDGEIFIKKVLTKDGLKLQLIEADALYSHTNNTGMTIDDNGAVTSYHFSKNNTSNVNGIPNTAKPVEVPADQIINYFRIERPTQYRGISEYKQAILDIKNFSAYQSATVQSARANAEIAYTVESERDSGTFGHTTVDQDEIQEINGLMVYYLKPGEKISKHNNNGAGANYGEFITNTVRMIATARNISYELAFRDYSQVNFASSRASLIQDNKRFDYEQSHLTSYFLNNVFREWLTIEVEQGRIPINIKKWNSNKDQFIMPRWSYPKREWVDPVKTVVAIEKEIALNLTTISDECAAAGKDFEEILITKQKEKELLKKYGLQQEEVKIA